MADSYKGSHYKQYPKGAETVYSYIESRGGEYDEVMFFGLQMFVQEYLSKPISRADINEAKEVFGLHGIPFNEDGWFHILREHEGYLPIEIRAVREGSVIPVKNVLCTVHNTDSAVPWLTSYVETMLLRAVWYPTTVATNSRECRKVIKAYMEETADNLDGLNFKLHDFGARGVSSGESAAIGGLAHLATGWQGSDTLEAIMAGRKYYSEPMAGFSIPAAEHSTITSWGRDSESEAYENMLEQFPTGLVAVVSDSYDLFSAIDNIWGETLKDKIIEREGTLVIRPDSGDPKTIVMETFKHLFERFGYTINTKGYKILPHYIRVIQGDGVNIQAIEDILEAMAIEGISADNIAFGMGGELLQKLNRDDQRFAMKASHIIVNGLGRDVFKDPITDRGKTSKKGILDLVREDGEYKTLGLEDSWDGGYASELLTYYYNGTVITDQTLAEIRQRCELT